MTTKNTEPFRFRYIYRPIIGVGWIAILFGVLALKLVGIKGPDDRLQAWLDAQQGF